MIPWTYTYNRKESFYECSCSGCGIQRVRLINEFEHKEPCKTAIAEGEYNVRRTIAARSVDEAWDRAK